MIWLLLGTALAQSPDFRSHLDQARFFVRRGWAEDALTELELAAATEDGRIDPDVWWLLAQVRLELGDLSGAEEAAEKAHSYARNDAQLHSASALASFLRDAFGTLHVDSNPGGLSSRLMVSKDENLVDPAIAAYFDRLAAELAEDGSQLPRDLELPVGTYLLNGIAAEVNPHEVSHVQLDPEHVLATRGGAAQLLRIDASLGVRSWLSLTDAHGPISPRFEVGLRQLIGAVAIGGSLSWSPQPHTRRDVSPVYGVGAGALGLRAGVPIRSPFGLWTPAVGYQLGVSPGIELACSSPDWSCTEDTSADLWVYANALTHGPFAELGFEFGDALRKTRWSPGVRAIGELGIGRLPKTGTARLVSGGEVVYTVVPETRHRMSPGFALSFTLSHGL